ncbi:MAG: hypothetical protein Q8Q17_03175 [bacterium]|nr:hypothetical protein [bacterium]
MGKDTWPGQPVQLSEQEQRENDIVKLARFIERTAIMYRNEDIPVRSDGRIDMQAYAKLHFDTRNDAEKTREWEKGWFGDIPDAQKLEKRRQMEGEQLEMLSYAIFIKNLGDEFVVVRSSPHDDRVNKVDTLILDRKTGTLVCAFDEVGAISGFEYDEKRSLVRDRNLSSGGATLKYGIGSENKDGRQSVILSKASNIPVFYIALDSENIKNGMKEFLPDMGNQSEFEKKLFSYFVSSITAQIEGLELNEQRLKRYPALKQKLTAFKDIMEPILSKIKKSQTVKKRGE